MILDTIDTYLLIKALHLIFVITWFAGLFYIPRLFVYHIEALDQPEAAQAYIPFAMIYSFNKFFN